MVRRNKLAVTAVFTVTLALVGGLATSIFFYERESEQKQQASKMAGLADENANRAKKVMAELLQLTETASASRNLPKQNHWNYCWLIRR